MGMFYCHGCDRYHDSKDGEYNVTADGKEYCDSALPESAEIECNNPVWHEVFAPTDTHAWRVAQNPQTYADKGEAL